ncbi:uncharacterized protein UV8b_03258 [Ustilaginoidea virens]|uniref:GDP-mannose transporter n=1 Tax=Ustilaginoidea virens TaxID=1159556 RepID=A0A063BKM1_USTVR|nr:uncharacterized protein UV8b_03258 [Ustilaginoidea virens]QUC19017.1 hypothetical protein UV8b_03258 [Ustilaginoidea virens]GAO18822.1 hypothetical protein UVI_02029970 [Ustilaginoidea virens]
MSLTQEAVLSGPLPVEKRPDVEKAGIDPPDEFDLLREADSERDSTAPLLDKEAPELPKASRAKVLFFIVVNILATVGIVFTNKAIFSHPSLKNAQLSFASFHFVITWLILHTLSRPRFAVFAPRRVSIREVAPLSVAMSCSVLFTNLSLTYSTITFYQVARTLLTPCVAGMNYFFYRAGLPRSAALALIPTCLGVGIVSYYEKQPAAAADDGKSSITSSLGIIFTVCGIFASSIYTVWVARYHRKLHMSSMQLLLNQIPVSAFFLLYFLPFVDVLPAWETLTPNRWVLILMSGLFAAAINISQFCVIAQTGPVSSTVVGHVKNCVIVSIGWAYSNKSIVDKSAIGLVLALGGSAAYSVITLKKNSLAQSKHGK